MKLDITEKERDILERLCTIFQEEKREMLRSSTFIRYSKELERDLICIYGIVIKLRELDANLMNKAMDKNDH